MLQVDSFLPSFFPSRKAPCLPQHKIFFTTIGITTLGMIRAGGCSFMREAVFSALSALGNRIFGPFKA